jgi:hypothetical protein
MLAVKPAIHFLEIPPNRFLAVSAFQLSRDFSAGTTEILGWKKAQAESLCAELSNLEISD